MSIRELESPFTWFTYQKTLHIVGNIMTNTILGENQRTASVMAKQAVDPNSQQKVESPESTAPSTVKGQDSSVELSVKLKNDIAAVNFDSKKVDQIKQSIEEGNYPLDNRKMAESFIPLEKLLS